MLIIYNCLLLKQSSTFRVDRNIKLVVFWFKYRICRFTHTYHRLNAFKFKFIKNQPRLLFIYIYINITCSIYRYNLNDWYVYKRIFKIFSPIFVLCVSVMIGPWVKCYWKCVCSSRYSFWFLCLVILFCIRLVFLCILFLASAVSERVFIPASIPSALVLHATEQ